MLYTTAVFWFALLRFLIHPIEVSGYKPNSGRACEDNREEFGFALAGHDFRSVHADNFARCFFECTLEERCQSVTFLWNKKECQMKIKTKQSRPDDFVENPAATYMENNFRGLSFQLFCFFGKDQVGWRVNLHSSYNEYRPITMYKIAGMTSVKEKNGKVNYDCARPNVPYHRNLSLSLFNFPWMGC